MNDKYNAIKVTLDDGHTFIVETTSAPYALAKLRMRGRVSESGQEVALVAKVYFDFNTEVVK